MAAIRLVSACVFAALVGACSGSGTADDDWRSGACLKHEDCAASELCILGRCSSDAGTEPVDVSAIQAAQWFADSDGYCEFDNECGPWMCFHGECVVPEVANRRMLPAGEYRYWDTSCYAADDCGPWICADGWCTQPGFVSPQATLAPHAAPPGGTTCLGDNECPEEADCVFPGYCQANAQDQTMTFVELGAIAWYSNPDGACTVDTQCGPHACVDGWCVAQDLTDRERPTRGELFYYDASCSDDSHCGSWVCRDGWCNDPAYE